MQIKRQMTSVIYLASFSSNQISWLRLPFSSKAFLSLSFEFQVSLVEIFQKKNYFRKLTFFRYSTIKKMQQAKLISENSKSLTEGYSRHWYVVPAHAPAYVV